MISSGLIYDQLSYGGLLWYIPLELGAQNIEALCGFWGLLWWLRWSRICLHCWRPGLNPGVRKIQYSCLENAMDRGAWQV